MVVRKMQNTKSLGIAVLIILFLPLTNVRAQRADTRVQSVQPIQPVQTVPVASASTASTAPAPAPTPSTYLLGPDDQITIQGPELDEVTNRPYRVDPEGYVSMPMLGRVKAGGSTIGDFDTQLNLAAAKYIRHPQLVASVAEFHSQPISVVGAVNQPGAQQLQGKKTLMQVISMVGGFRPDAGNMLTITRESQWGPLPLPNATTDSSGKYSVADISIPELLKEKSPQLNIPIMPNDVITIPVSETVYVVGDVHKAGGFLLGEHKDMTVLQAVAMAEGISGTADSKHSRIIHHAESAERTETPINVKLILAGKAEDVPLNGGDILFVPGSVSKKAGLRTAEAVIQTASGMAVWGRF
jgi:polysaccharide export outer membrane protein